MVELGMAMGRKEGMDGGFGLELVVGGDGGDVVVRGGPGGVCGGWHAVGVVVCWLAC